LPRSPVKGFLARPRRRGYRWKISCTRPASSSRYPIQQGSLSERDYSVIRDRILRGTYPLGAPLSRLQLAAESGMSLLPLAEALQKLKHEGLVETRPRVGTRVRCPTPEDLRDHCILREAFETQAARLFAEKASLDERSGSRVDLSSAVAPCCFPHADCRVHWLGCFAERNQSESSAGFTIWHPISKCRPIGTRN